MINKFLKFILILQIVMFIIQIATGFYFSPYTIMLPFIFLGASISLMGIWHFFRIVAEYLKEAVDKWN